MIILTSKKIVPISEGPITNGAIAVKGKRIVDIGTKKSIRNKYTYANLVDLGEHILMPGLINTHAHLELSYLENLHNEERDFFKWIIRLIDKRRELGQTGLKPAATKALKQAVSTGTTSIGDITGTGLVIGPVKSSGIRCVIFHEVIGMDPGTAESSLRHLNCRLKRFEKLPGRMTQGVSPHSSYSVNDQLFRGIADVISRDALPLCIHLSETIDEVDHIKGRRSDIETYLKYVGWSRYKSNRAHSPISLLNDYNLPPNPLVVHAVHINKTDINRLVKHGASVSHCPRSNHLLNVGRAPVRKLLDAGVNVALGTDSLASNLDLDIWEELRFAYLVNELTAEETLRMATVNGARALGLENVTGALEPGKEADIIAVSSTAARDRDPYPALVCKTRGSDVVLSMVQGKVIYNKNGIEL